MLPKAEGGADIAQLAHRTGHLPVHAIVTGPPASLFGMLSCRESEVPAGGDELGRRGPFGGARRIVET